MKQLAARVMDVFKIYLTLGHFITSPIHLNLDERATVVLKVVILEEKKHILSSRGCFARKFSTCSHGGNDSSSTRHAGWAE